MTDRRLKPCPNRPNCVSTQAADAVHRMPALPYRDLTEARARLLAVLATQPRCRLITVEETYVHAECRSEVFHFVDDVELLFDEAAHLLHFRSAARLGYRDFRVNRERMEAISGEFLRRAPAP